MTLRAQIKSELAVYCVDGPLVDACILKANMKIKPNYAWDMPPNPATSQPALKAVTTEIVEHYRKHKPTDPFIEQLDAVL